MPFGMTGFFRLAVSEMSGARRIVSAPLLNRVDIFNFLNPIPPTNKLLQQIILWRAHFRPVQLYRQVPSGGIEARMDSVRPPDCKPKCIPRPDPAYRLFRRTAWVRFLTTSFGMTINDNRIRSNVKSLRLSIAQN